MKIEDIKVGKKYYYCKGNKKTILLGVGMRTLFTNDEFTQKHLVIIETQNSDSIGQMIQEGDNCENGFWDKKL
jgi:hypothetical protein